MKNITVLAIGGNAIDGDSHKEEGRNILKTLNGIEEPIRAGPLVITHGNGPQVGRLVEQTGLPLWLCTAQTQGEIGTLILQNLNRYLERYKISKKIVVVQTHVLINPMDPSLRRPSKPIGSFFDKKEAEKLMKKGYRMKKDLVKDETWRRMVPSPEPTGIIEMEAIELLLEKDYIVIAGGGGGVPVYKSPDGLVPIEAIVDKDYTSSLMGISLKAERLILLTNIDAVKINFLKEGECALRIPSIKDVKLFLEKGHFKTGMETKVRAAINFLENGGSEAIIANIFDLKKALSNQSGTLIKK